MVELPPEVRAHLERHPLPPERLAAIEAGRRRLHAQVLREFGAPPATPARHAPPAPLHLHADRLRQRLAQAEAARRAGPPRPPAPPPPDPAARARAAQLAWLARAGVPPQARGWSFATFPDQEHPALAALEEFASAWDGRRWLVLHGGYGVGKTGLAVAAMAAVAPVLLGARAWFCPETELLDALRAELDGGPRVDPLAPALLVIDDLGAARQTDWGDERLLWIIDRRYTHERATWFTTNLGLPALRRRLGERLFWRIVDRALALEVVGANLRAVRR